MPTTHTAGALLTPPLPTPASFAISVSGTGLVNGSGQPTVLRGMAISGPEYQPAQQGNIFEPGFKTDLSTYWLSANVLRIPVNAYAWLDGAVPPPTSSVPSGQTSPAYSAAAQAAPPSPYVANPGLYPNPPGQSTFHHLPNGSTVLNFATVMGAPYRAAITNLINLCATNNLYAMLDLHWTDPFVQPGWSTANQNTGGNGQGNMPDYYTWCFWDHAAYTFRSSPWVLFEMMNEPWGSNVAQAATQTVVQQSYSPGSGEWGIYANGGLCLMVPGRGSWNGQNVNVTSGTGYNTAGSGGQVTITSVAVAFGTATVTCGANHGLVTGQSTMILGCATTAFNGIQTVQSTPSLTQFRVATGLGSVTAGVAAFSVACFNSIGFQSILNTIRTSGAQNVVVMPGLKAEGTLNGLSHPAYGLPITDTANQLALGIHLYSIPGGNVAGLIADTQADTNGSYPLLCTELPPSQNGDFGTHNGLIYPLEDASNGTMWDWQQLVAGRPNASTIVWAFSQSNSAGGNQACIVSQSTGRPCAGYPAWPITAVAGNVLTIPKAVGFLSIGDTVSAWLGGFVAAGSSSWAALDTVASINGNNFTMTNAGGSINYTTATYLGTADAHNQTAGSGWGFEQWMIDTYGAHR